MTNRKTLRDREKNRLILRDRHGAHVLIVAGIWVDDLKDRELRGLDRVASMNGINTKDRYAVSVDEHGAIRRVTAESVWKGESAISAVLRESGDELGFWEEVKGLR